MVSSSEKSVEPSSCERFQSILTLSNNVFCLCRAWLSYRIMNHSHYNASIVLHGIVIQIKWASCDTLPALCKCGVPFPARCPAAFYPVCFDSSGRRPLVTATSSPRLCRAARKGATPSRRRRSFCLYHRTTCSAPGNRRCANCSPFPVEWLNAALFRPGPAIRKKNIQILSIFYISYCLFAGSAIFIF